jgi:Holliday junction resolvasome RuvABC DNA-binding subunit
MKKALVSNQTHESTRLLSVKKNVEKVYGFNQKMEKQAFKPLPKNQETIMDYLRP